MDELVEGLTCHVKSSQDRFAPFLGRRSRSIFIGRETEKNEVYPGPQVAIGHSEMSARGSCPLNGGQLWQMLSAKNTGLHAP